MPCCKACCGASAIALTPSAACCLCLQYVDNDCQRQLGASNAAQAAAEHKLEALRQQQYCSEVGACLCGMHVLLHR
jgi:hypothetical protein